MTRLCSVHNCTKHVSGYSPLCELHKRNQRRHGHPEQCGVTVHDLRPFQNSITARRVKNPTNPTWPLLERRWEALTGHAAATLAGYSDGSPAVSYERQTAEQLLSLRDTVRGEVVIDTSLAMYSMWEQRPGQFRSDRAFNFQLARRVRGLAPANTSSHWSEKDGRTKTTFRDIPPRVLECLAASLGQAFGVVGLKLAGLEIQEAADARSERDQLQAALREMK